MKATELRIGNLVGTNESIGGAYKVAKFDENETLLMTQLSGGYTTPTKELYGLPLTEEWLKKFGLQKNESGHWCNLVEGYYCYIEIVPFKNGIYQLGIEGHYDARLGYTSEIKYVHQLQNLYFALTGEELQS
ncbi:hypothetical protein LCGC14_0536910 [marine sediment metagenome]|uniref:Uncharacterized protein n=1 Tax=marine sediment metagenome TaxID=412755 RepID=A0A0F9UFD1_9ZZZZ